MGKTKLEKLKEKFLNECKYEGLKYEEGRELVNEYELVFEFNGIFSISIEAAKDKTIYEVWCASQMHGFHFEDIDINQVIENSFKNNIDKYSSLVSQFVEARDNLVFKGR